MKNFILLALFSICINSYAGQLLNSEQKLGERLFKDKNLSFNKNQACASCHSLGIINNKSKISKLVPGFVDPNNVKTGSAVSSGSIQGSTGNLNSPSVGYAAFSPEFHWDEEEGLYLGGQFWNGRASDLIEQAKKPFLNPLEMAMPSELAVINRKGPCDAVAQTPATPPVLCKRPSSDRWPATKPQRRPSRLAAAAGCLVHLVQQRCHFFLDGDDRLRLIKAAA